MPVKFSVIIPSYNRENFIEKCMNSVSSQSFENYEIIIVDDGSTDKTKEIVNIYSKGKKQKVIYIYQDNQGPASARNTGIFHASGNYIAFLDSDDTWTKDKLKSVNYCIEEHSGYKIFHTQEKWFKNGKIHNPKKKHKKPEGYIFNNAVKMCSVSMSTAVIKKEIFNKIGGFDENFPVCEDYDFWVRASLKYRFYLINKVLTVKDGGRPDQLSFIYAAKDKYRIKSLVNLIKSEILTHAQFNSVITELENKCSIYAKGCLKRNRIDEAQYHFTLCQKIKEKYD